MIRPATDRQVLFLRLAARAGGDGAIQLPAADVRALLARLDHAEHQPEPMPVRVDIGQHRPLAIDLATNRPTIARPAHWPTLGIDPGNGIEWFRAGP